MQNLVIYAVESGEPRPLASCSPDDASRFFVLNSAGVEYARLCRARGVAVPPLLTVLEERVTDAGGVALAKQEFSLVDPATFDATGESANTLADLLKARAKAEADAKAEAEAEAKAKAEANLPRQEFAPRPASKRSR